VLVVSYTTVSPLLRLLAAVCSLWHCPAGHPGWALPTTLPCGVRTFLDTVSRAAITRLARPGPEYRFASLLSVLMLLPPSEGKSAADSGPTVDLATLSFPDLTPTRTAVLAALVKLCSGNGTNAAKVLGLGPTQHGEVGANAQLAQEPCAPAIDVYTGVLYEALDASSLTTAGRRRLQESVAISSALWGLVRPQDLIPSYRLSGGTTLPRLGPLASIWREHVSALLEDTDELVIDMRSGAYVSLGPLTPEMADRSVTVRVLTERNGKRSVVSHNNKATKGLLVRHLVSTRRRPECISALVQALESGGFEIELGAGSKGAAPILDVILR